MKERRLRRCRVGRLEGSLVSPSMRPRVGAIVAGLCFLAGPLVGRAQDIWIDDFRISGSPSEKLQMPAGGSTSALYANPGTIGGFREVSFSSAIPVIIDEWVFFETPIAGAQSGRPIGAALNTLGGANPAADVDWTFTYNLNGAGLNADLSPLSRIALQWETDHVAFSNDTSMSITLIDGANRSHTSTVIWQSPADRAHNLSLETSWLLDDFAAAGVDLRDIDTIRWTGNSDFAMDAGFSGLAVIPEPTALALSGIGLGIASLRRRRAT